MAKLFVGVDVGSVSTNLAILDDQGALLFDKYYRNDGQPLRIIQTGMAEIRESFKNSTISGVGVTGSGRLLAGAVLGADVVKNEITAHATAAINFYPDVHTILEIGGQDSKIIIVRDRVVIDFAMNTVCAAGTGSFLDHQAERLKAPIGQFGDLALTAVNRVKIAGRCTVFAESDTIAKQQLGFSKAEIINGLCEALVRNYLTNLARDKVLEGPVVFQGGVAANRGIRAAFERELKMEIVVPRYYDVMGAIGAALLARKQWERTGAESRFRGFNRLNMELKPAVFECKGCNNRREVIRVEQEGIMIAVWGDKCRKYSNEVSA